MSTFNREKMKGINELFVRNIPKLSGISEYLVRKQPVRRYAYDD